MSGLCKILMCMKHEEIPPQVHYRTLNPMITIDTIPAKIPLEVTPWISGDNRLIADVSSFGFGGSNAHACMEKYVKAPVAPAASDRPVHVLPLSAITTAPLLELAAKFTEFLGSSLESLTDVCYTAGHGRNHFANRIAVTCATKEQASAALAKVRARQRRGQPTAEADVIAAASGFVNGTFR